MSDRSHRVAGWLTKAASPVMRRAGRTFFDLEISGADHIPAEGGFVVAANHLSHIDPVVVTMSIGREIRYIALDELFGSGAVFDAITLFFGAIPTNRDGAPLGALKEAIRHIHRGGVVGLFPEGRRVAYWGESPPKRGAAWLAWLTGAPLLPVTVHGTHRTLSPATKEEVRRPSLRVWIDSPLEWSEYAGSEDPVGAMTEQWRVRVGDHLATWWPDHQ